jgi:hypothetical protein
MTRIDCSVCSTSHPTGRFTHIGALARAVPQLGERLGDEGRRQGAQRGAPAAPGVASRGQEGTGGQRRRVVRPLRGPDPGARDSARVARSSGANRTRSPSGRRSRERSLLPRVRAQSLVALLLSVVTGSTRQLRGGRRREKVLHSIAQSNETGRQRVWIVMRRLNECGDEVVYRAERCHLHVLGEQTFAVGELKKVVVPSGIKLFANGLSDRADSSQFLGCDPLHLCQMMLLADISPRSTGG